jgi:hypothetical protein
MSSEPLRQQVWDDHQMDHAQSAGQGSGLAQAGVSGWIGRGVASALRSSLQLTAVSVRALGNGAAAVIPIVIAPMEATFGAIAQGATAAQSATAATADAALRLTIRVVVDAALRELDLTQIVREYVDINSLATDVDLDAIIDRVDIDAIAAGIDLDRIVDRLDIGRVLNRVDIDEVAGRIDIDAITARIDLNQIATRIDIDPLIARANIDAVIAKIDLNDIATRIDIDPLIARANIEAVIAKVNLIGLATEVIDGIDLPAIIRQSSGAMSSDAVQGIRSQSRAADDALAAFVGRLFGKGDVDPVVSSS